MVNEGAAALAGTWAAAAVAAVAAVAAAADPSRVSSIMVALITIVGHLHLLAQVTHRLGRVNTMMPIYRVIRVKKQRLAVLRGVHGIDQWVLHTPHDSNPACL
jgi:hypothetical protein